MARALRISWLQKRFGRHTPAQADQHQGLVSDEALVAQADQHQEPISGEALVAQHWDQAVPVEARQAISWMEHPRVKQYINARTTGDPSLDWLTYVARKYLATPARRALSLGCGTGGLERHALWLGAVETFDAVDISPHSLAQAQALAEKEGLASRVLYRVADVNHLTLDPNQYDAVWCSMSLHHVEALERVYEQSALALRPGGYFICNEFVGPNHVQLPPKRVEIINDLLAALPTSFRRIIRDGIRTDEIKTEFCNAPLTWFAENDPSEAVRSADLLPLLEQFFDIVELRPYGGGLLQCLLENIVGNFQHPHEEHDAWLGLICHLEHLLEREGIIDSDFALIVATAKQEPGSSSA